MTGFYVKDDKINRWLIHGSTLSILGVFSIIGLLISALVGGVIVQQQYNIGRESLWFVIYSITFIPVICGVIYKVVMSYMTCD